MELIKVNSSKLKIILSSADIEKLGLSSNSTDCEDNLSMESLREILETAREQTGFVSGSSRLYIQFYPSKDGGGEMYITKKQYSENKFSDRHFGDSSNIPKENTYIAIFTSFENLLALCKRLLSDQFIGESTLYSYKKNYILKLCGYSYNNFYSYLGEYSSSFVADNIKLAFIEEHATELCKNTTVETFCEKFGLTI